MPARFFTAHDLVAHEPLTLTDGTARHIQVLRLQPGANVTLFNGDGSEWTATISHMGRSEVTLVPHSPTKVNRELPYPVTLAVGMPTNDRMDGLVEKATELGVAVIAPLMCERSVLRLSGERAEKKRAHWQAVATAACEQSGRTRIPSIEPVCTLTEWLSGLPPVGNSLRYLLSPPREGPADAPAHLVQASQAWRAESASIFCLSGPEGGLTLAEESAARQAGWIALSLGPRVLRADTAPLAFLAYLALSTEPG